MGETYRIIYRSFDALKTEMLTDVLRDAGFTARMLGTRSAASIGVGQYAVRVQIEVPQTEADEASLFLADFENTEGEELLREAGAYGDAEEGAAGLLEPASHTDRNPFLAVGFALVVGFGAGHYYVRRGYTALGILLGYVIAFAHIFNKSADSMLVGGVMLVALKIADIAGSLWVIRCSRRGISRPVWYQVVWGLAVVGLSWGAAWLLTPEIRQWQENHNEAVDGTPSVKEGHELHHRIPQDMTVEQQILKLAQ